jgi:hypothetical protein
MWRHAWVDGVDQYDHWYPETYRLVQNSGTGLLMQGTCEWTDYAVSAVATPHMALSCGIGARCQGMRRYVALTLGHDAEGQRSLLLSERRDNEQRQVAQPFDWQYGRSYDLKLAISGTRAMAEARSQESEVRSQNQAALTLEGLTLAGGGIALLCEEGRASFAEVRVAP